MLVCEEHKEDAENLRFPQAYRKEHISRFSFLPDYSKNIKFSFHWSASYATKSSDDTSEDDDIFDSTIYTWQTVLKINPSICSMTKAVRSLVLASKVLTSYLS